MAGARGRSSGRWRIGGASRPEPEPGAEVPSGPFRGAVVPGPTVIDESRHADGAEFEEIVDRSPAILRRGEECPIAGEGMLGEGAGADAEAKVELMAPHCDPTVNLYDWIVGVRGSRVECLWPVAARGALG